MPPSFMIIKTVIIITTIISLTITCLYPFVQRYWACFGLYPSSSMWKTKKSHNVSETGSVSVLRFMGQDKPTQLGPLERASLNHWTYKTMDKVQNKPNSSVQHTPSSESLQVMSTCLLIKESQFQASTEKETCEEIQKDSTEKRNKE
jgi:hypothetical protein